MNTDQEETITMSKIYTLIKSFDKRISKLEDEKTTSLKNIIPRKTKRTETQMFHYFEIYDVSADQISLIFYNNREMAVNLFNFNKEQFQMIIRSIESTEMGENIIISDYTIGKTCCFVDGSWKVY